MKYFFVIFCFFIHSAILSQAIYVDDMPADSNDSFTLFINVAEAGSGLYDILQLHPEDMSNVHIWIWSPTEPFVGNGSWNNSNQELLMTHESDYIFSIFISQPEFFNVGNEALFENGISCLAKLDNGNAHANDGFGEAKTSDLHLALIPNSISVPAKTDITFWEVFPNPCADNVNIVNPGNHTIRSIRVSSVSGELIRKERVSGVASNFVLNTSGLPVGYYLIEISDGTTISRKKLMKK